jgi:hypothetical protein
LKELGEFDLKKPIHIPHLVFIAAGRGHLLDLLIRDMVYFAAGAADDIMDTVRR